MLRELNEVRKFLQLILYCELSLILFYNLNLSQLKYGNSREGIKLMEKYLLNFPTLHKMDKSENKVIKSLKYKESNEIKNSVILAYLTFPTPNSLESQRVLKIIKLTFSEMCVIV